MNWIQEIRNLFIYLMIAIATVVNSIGIYVIMKLTITQEVVFDWYSMFFVVGLCYNQIFIMSTLFKHYMKTKAWIYEKFLYKFYKEDDQW